MKRQILMKKLHCIILLLLFAFQSYSAVRYWVKTPPRSGNWNKTINFGHQKNKKVKIHHILSVGV